MHSLHYRISITITCLQVRRVDQTRYPMTVVASLSAVPQSCRTPLQHTSKHAHDLKLKSRCSLGSPHTHTPRRGIFLCILDRLGRFELSSEGCTFASAAKCELACITVAYSLSASYGVRLLFLFLVEEVALEVGADAVIVASAKPVC